MRLFARLSLATLALGFAAPISVIAQEPSPAGAAPVAAKPTHHHVFFGKGYCAKCGNVPPPIVKKTDKRRAAPHVHTYADVAKSSVVPASMPGGEVVSCSHQSKGVCKECSALLSMPGQVNVVGKAAPAAGRAVASDKAPGFAVAEAGEPEPIGVMRTNYNNSAAAPAGMPAPGRAVVNGSARQTASAAAAPSVGRDPFMPASAAPRPHIIGHLFGISEMSNDFRDTLMARGKRRKDTHAAISYGAASASVEELPASMVYGRDAR